MNFDLFSSHLVHSPSSSLDVNMSFYCESPAAIINNQVHLIPENHHNRNRVNNLTYRDPMYSSIPAIPSILNRPVNNQSTNCLPYNHHHHHHHPHLNVSTSPLVYNQQQRFQHHLNHPNQYYNLNYQSYQQQQQQQQQQQSQQQQPQQYHPHHPHHHRPHQYPKQFGDNDNFQIYHNVNQQQFNYNESPMDANNLGINCVQVEKNDSSAEAPINSVVTDDGQKVVSSSSSSSNQNALSVYNQQPKHQQHQCSKGNLSYSDFHYQITQSATGNSDGNHKNDSYNISTINNNQREYTIGCNNNNNDRAPASNCTPNDDEIDEFPKEVFEMIEKFIEKYSLVI